MANHLVTGLIEVRITCGDCDQAFDQPGLNPAERPGWIVCPHCNYAAPVNTTTDLGTQFDALLAEEHRRLQDALDQRTEDAA